MSRHIATLILATLLLVAACGERDLRPTDVKESMSAVDTALDRGDARETCRAVLRLAPALDAWMQNTHGPRQGAIGRVATGVCSRVTATCHNRRPKLNKLRSVWAPCRSQLNAVGKPGESSGKSILIWTMVVMVLLGLGFFVIRRFVRS